MNRKPALLMTGAHGFLGTILSRFLTSSGYRVFHGDFDVTQPSHIQKFAGQCPEDAVILHLAGIAAIGDCERDPVVAHRVNSEGPSHVFKAFPKCPHFVFFSSGQVYKDKPNGRISEVDPIETKTVYAQTKRAAELRLQGLAADADSRLTILRLFNHVHKTQGKNAFMSRTYHELLDMRAPGTSLKLRTGFLEVVRDFGAVQDINTAVLNLLSQAGPRTGAEIYNLSSGVGKNLRRIVEGLAKRVGVSPEIEQDSSLTSDRSVALIGDPSKLMSEFGWQPRAVDEDRLIDFFVADLEGLSRARPRPS